MAIASKVVNLILLIFLCAVAIFINSKKIILTKNNKEIGFISYSQIFPWPLSIYILYDFYIKPDFRNNGFGKMLLKFSVDKLVKMGSKKIFIQPGPYETSETGVVNKENNNINISKLNKLIKLYNSNKFDFAPKIFCKIAAIIYWVLRIKEDSKYLMVYCS